MRKTKIHYIKKFEISIVELKNHTGKKYKVTRRYPDLSVAETKIFRSKKQAKKQFDEWLS